MTGAPSRHDLTTETFRWAVVAMSLVASATLFYLAWLPDVAALASVNPMTTKYVQIFVRRNLRQGQRPAVAMRWVPLEDISPHLIHAVLIAEDDAFYRHAGVDWRALKRAARYNWRQGRLVRGGSTITQQVARNLFLSPSRHPKRKLKEILYARHLERSLTKARILEIYLNIVEWGEGIFGAEAASRAYYGKPARDLSPEEAVALAAALPSPYRWNPAAEPDERTVKIRQLYLERMRRAGYLPPEPDTR